MTYSRIVANESGTVPGNERSTSWLIKAGAPIYGNVIGVTLGGVIGGPLGAVAAAVASPALEVAFEWVSKELMDRQLSTRGIVRAGAALGFAVARLEELLESGQQVRDDGFFNEDVAGSAGAEIIEGTLLAAQRQHEEKKIQFYGNLLAAIAIDPEIDRGFANLLIRRAEELSYRQLCLLAIIKDHARFDLRDVTRKPEDTWKVEAVIAELDDLGYAKLEMVGVESPDGRLPTNIGQPSALRLRGWGELVHSTMNLEDIQEDDLGEVASLLA